MISRRPSLAQVLAQVGVPDDQHARARQALADHEDGPVWYVALFAGFAAWLSAVLLLGFLFGTQLVSAGSVALSVGAVFATGASLLRNQPVAERNTFLNQLSLAGVVAGEILVVIGAVDILPDWLGFLLGGFGLVGMLFAFPDAAHRFGATVAAAALLTAALYHLDEALPVHVLATPLFAGALALFVFEPPLEVGRFAKLRAPAAYGCVASTFLLVMVALWGPDEQQAWSLATSIGLAVVALGGLSWTVHRELQLDAWVIGVVAIVGVGLAVMTAGNPGVVAALAVLLLAHHRRSPLLFGFGAAFLAVFLTWFYYDLSLSLYVKSAVLVGSGLTLWLARWAVVQFSPEEA